MYSFLNAAGGFFSRLAGQIGLRTRFILIGFAASLPLVLILLNMADQERDRAMSAALDRVSLLASVAAEREAQLDASNYRDLRLMMEEARMGTA